MKNLDYGVIGNCRSAALISRNGSIDWCCLPYFDSPSVFAKLLDQKKGGCFSIDVDDSYTVSQRYFPRTNILFTGYRSGQNAFEVIDFMPRYKTSDNEYYAPSEIYRYIRLLSGAPVFRVRYEPKLNYAIDEVSHITEENHIRTYSRLTPTDCIYLYSSLNPGQIMKYKEILLEKEEFLLLSYNQKVVNIDIRRVYHEYIRTKVYWINWSDRSKKYEPYNDEIIRSLLILKLMSFHPTGAVLAA